MSKFFAYLTEQDGFSAAEYALGFAVVGVVVGAAASSVGGFLGHSAGFINGVAECLRTHSHVTAC
jgi:Flp pilus assembly pilin Flp